jgi:uncharacterized repeat protein (TIGR01451 family)
VSISFRVTIDDPLPAGVTQVANQGLVNSNGLPALPTDDPDTPLIGDPTITPVYTSPGLVLNKTVINSGPVHPGELVTFTLSITNTGHTTFTRIPMADVYNAAYLSFARAVPAPNEVRQTANKETGQAVWNDLAVQFGPLSPDAAIEVLVVMTATAVTSQTLNNALVEDAVDNYGNRLSAYATAPVAILRGPVSIELLYFRAQSKGNVVLLSWETVFEIENYGFELYRNHLRDLRTATQIAFLPGRGTGMGQHYSHTDWDVVSGNRYWYWLVDIDTTNGRTVHAPLEVYVHSVYPVYLPILLQDCGGRNTR